MATPNTPYPERAHLLQREATDRAARSEMFDAFQHPDLSQQDARQIMQRLHVMAVESAQDLRRCVDAYGWPDPQHHAKDLVSAVLYLAQHAQNDEALQRDSLDLARAAFDEGWMSAEEFAQTVDHLYLGVRGEQEYGTQFHMENGTLLLRPVRDRATVEARRADLGLPTLEEQRNRTEAQFEKLAAGA